MNIQVLSPDSTVRGLFITPQVCDVLNDVGAVGWNELGRQYTTEEFINVVRVADVLISGWGCPRLTREVMHLAGHCPKLLVHMGGTVAPYIDQELFSHGIRAVCANEYFAKSVAEGNIAYMLAGLREIPYWNNEVQQGRWRSEDYGSRSLFGKKVGLVGYGAITRYLIPLLKAFETKINLYSEHLSQNECEELGVNKASLDEIFSQCDIISLHCSLTDKTRLLVDGSRLRSIRNGALFINTARAGVVDTLALQAELATGRFSAVLDVFDQEPLSDASPLRGLRNVILTPHMAGPAIDLYGSIGLAMAAEINRWRDGFALCYEVTAEQASRMTAKG